MTYSTSLPILPLPSSLSHRRSQSQQIPWTYESREDRTAVTNSTNIIEAAQEPASPQIINNQGEYWISISKKLQDTARSVGNQHIGTIWEITPSLRETILINLVRSRLIGNWHVMRNSWEIMPSSTEAFHSLSRIVSAWNTISTSATYISEAQLQLIEGQYVFRNDIEVKHFLREHPFLVWLLLDTYSKIEAHFPDSQVFLEVATDFEAFDYYSNATNSDKELLASISTHLPPEEALDALNKFYDDWWLKALEEAKGKISFSLELL
mgnify:CR=1 FL=1